MAGNEVRLRAGKNSLALIQIHDRAGQLQIYGAEKCKGRARPRLNNIDSIALDLRRSAFSLVVIFTAGPVLGPGATREDDGASEIEVRAERLTSGLALEMGGADDSVALTALDEETTGANMTAAVDDDIDIRAPTRTEFQIFMGDGDDTATLEPGTPRGARGLPFPFGDSIVFGDSGDDVIFGSSGSDLIGGGSGSDTISGGGGFDFIEGGEEEDLIRGGGDQDFLDAGSGRDEVEGGGGKDFVEAADTKVDRLDCGDGSDAAEIDRHRDSHVGCEDIRTGRRRLRSALGEETRERIDDAQQAFRHHGG